MPFLSVRRQERAPGDLPVAEGVERAGRGPPAGLLRAARLLHPHPRAASGLQGPLRLHHGEGAARGGGGEALSQTGARI